MLKSKPIAVIISDIHFTVATLDLADAALSHAMARALELKVPLVIAGDTLDSKAIIRAECANRLLEIFQAANASGLERQNIFMLVGNHDLLNEKGEGHSLNFLAPYCTLVQSPVYCDRLKARLIPYMGNASALQEVLNHIPDGSTLILHQGVQTAFMGHYQQDKASLPKEAFADFRVISGHYHRAQDIKCGRPRKGSVGLFSYVGNPYTISFGEHEDGEKGYRILKDNGSLELVPLNLRRHYVFTRTTKEIHDMVDRGPREAFFNCLKPEDLVWLKINGTRSELAQLDKKELGEKLFGHQNFKLDKIATDETNVEGEVEDMLDHEILDALIDSTGETTAQRDYLKALWRKIL